MAGTLNLPTSVVIEPDEVVAFVRALIRRPSVTGEEGDLAQYLAQTLEDFGLGVQLREVAEGRMNVVARLAGEDPTPALLFHAHMDTVPAGPMERPFSAEIADDHIWGRGSVDQKGGLAAAIMALAAIARSGMDLRSSLALAVVVDEESEHRGSMALVEDGLEARQAVITEPSDLRMVFGCKGTLPFQIRVRGRAAHGCRPWLGVNAVRQAMEVAAALESLPCAEYEIPGHGPVTGSLNLGVIEGGRAYNIVPDECVMWFDRRTVPGERQEEVLEDIQALLDHLAANDPSLRASLQVARPDWNWEPIRQRGLRAAVTPPGSPILDLVARHHVRVMGQEVERYFTDGYQEMDFLVNDLNIPTVQYGPGDNRLCHTDEERLSISQLIRATKVYTGAALEAALQ